MKPEFIADENIPFSLIKALRELGYEVATVGETAYFGIKNNELAELSIRQGKIIMTRDADFTRLKRSLGARSLNCKLAPCWLVNKQPA
jgi:predicted nuclease of predicted toxin-antitoxin system